MVMDVLRDTGDKQEGNWGKWVRGREGDQGLGGGRDGNGEQIPWLQWFLTPRTGGIKGGGPSQARLPRGGNGGGKGKGRPKCVCGKGGLDDGSEISHGCSPIRTVGTVECRQLRSQTV